MADIGGPPMLSKNSLAEVLGILGPDLCRLVSAYRLVLAGGFIRDVIAGVLPKDIDFFVSGTGLLLSKEGPGVEEAISDCFGASDRGLDSQHPGIVTWRSEGDAPAVQLISRRNFDSPIQLIGGFDLTMAQAAVWMSGSDEWESVCGPCFHPDANNKILRLVAGPERTSVRRLHSFFERGWKPPPLEEGERMKDYPDWGKAVAGAPFR